MAIQKLRTSYKKYQDEVFAQNPKYVGPARVFKYSEMAQGQIDSMQNNNNFTNYEEAFFYKEKFQKLGEVATQYEKKSISETAYHRQVRKVLQKDYYGNTSTVRSKSGNLNNLQVPTPYQKQQRPINRSGREKSPLKEFFDEKQMTFSKQKVTFNTLMPSNQLPMRMGIKVGSRSISPRSPSKRNDGEIRRLKDEIDRLKQQISNTGNAVDNKKLRELQDQIYVLNRENTDLRSELTKTNRSEIVYEEQYDPYNLRVRPNNMKRIHSINLNMSQRASQFGGSSDYIRQPYTPKVYYDKDGDNKSEFTHNAYTPNMLKNKSNNYLDDPLNTSKCSIQTYALNLQESELYDKEKNSTCRQKIAFFKKQMMICKGNDYDIAFKRSDLNYQMDKLRLNLYINNKDNRSHSVNIIYDYESSEYDLHVQKKLTSVNASSQGRQQILITLKNARDLNNTIEAKVTVDGHQKIIVVPALFIDFDANYRNEFQDIGYLERNLTTPLKITPMTQFQTYNKASHILNMVRDNNSNLDVGILYGKSKSTKGIVKLTWRNKMLTIETCEQWKILMTYLLLNADES